MDSYIWIMIRHPSRAAYNSGLGVLCDLAIIYNRAFFYKNITFIANRWTHIWINVLHSEINLAKLSNLMLRIDKLYLWKSETRFACMVISIVVDGLATQRSWGISSHESWWSGTFQFHHRKTPSHIPILSTGRHLVSIRFCLHSGIIRPTYGHTTAPFVYTAGNYSSLNGVIVGK